MAIAAALALTVIGGAAIADFAAFTDSFDDGDWTSNPRWEYVQTGPVSVSNERSVSAPYSLKVASNNEMGAIKAFSGLTSATASYTSTFKLYVESLGDEAIPWALMSTSGSVTTIIFILPGGVVQLFVTDSTEIWSGKSANVAYPLTYGQWHSFRITYDGATTRLYLDGHTDPDASVTQSYVRVPGRVCVGNFSLPHTSTFYLDDLVVSVPTQPNPAPVYIQMCSDTSTGGISVNSRYMDFPELDTSYTSPTGQAARVMAESFRTAHRDSLGNPVKFTWYMLVGSLYAYGTDTGPLLPFELMQDYHGPSIELWGDELAYHYHSWIWSDPDGDSVYHWNQATDFTPCVDDFDRTLAHLILDRSFYPSSFRSGWHGMDNFYQAYLDDWIPYRFENAYPAYRTDTTEPVSNVYDWRRAPSAWIPYHPDANDYQSPGDLRGWDSRCQYMKSVSRSQIEDAFLQALAGTPQLMTLFSHLKEADFPDQITNLHAMLNEIHDSLPVVEFEYLTGRECMLKWRNGSDTTPPEVQVTTSDANGIRAAEISTNEPIYQKQPFVARADQDGVYSKLECTALGENRWRVQYGIEETSKAAVGITDLYGNPRVKFLPTPLRLMNAATSAGTTTAEITWETNNPAETKLDYALAPYGQTTTVHDTRRTVSHKVTLSNLQPGSVYRVRLSAEDEFGQQAESEDLYLITKLSNAVIIDNQDAGFSVTGTWSTGTSAGDRYGADYRYAGTSPTGTSRAYWTWTIAQTGIYEVCAWWSGGSNRSTSAKYHVLCNGVEYPKTMNQQIDGGKWNSLGTFSLVAGENVTVRLSNAADSGFVVIADAVKLEQPYVPVSSLGLARCLRDGVEIHSPRCAVTAVFGSEFYIEALDRSAAVKVEGAGVTEGEVVEVCGAMSTSAGERVITDTTVNETGETVHLKPVSPAGRHNWEIPGMFVTTWGRVETLEAGYFYADDGSGFDDGTGNTGIRVDSSLLSSPPSTPAFAIVTGLVGAKDLGSQVIPLIRPRSPSELTFIPL